ncbi:hypothetical protein FN846DRAFT_1013826 [Sphaerosporella brunnea]|uniref:Uncharacterized protein n=1 Tax=Sphaerosporella brunnea TaxID=1250544 RepID=A0A5J5F9E1_9PEZI|nr:hypothetical protein FN846DRAFT_1013826 [Sphaerosporella brunnea]
MQPPTPPRDNNPLKAAGYLRYSLHIRASRTRAPPTRPRHPVGADGTCDEQMFCPSPSLAAGCIAQFISALSPAQENLVLLVPHDTYRSREVVSALEGCSMLRRRRGYDPATLMLTISTGGRPLHDAIAVHVGRLVCSMVATGPLLSKGC